MLELVKSSAVRLALQAGFVVKRDLGGEENGYRYQTVVLGRALAPWLDGDFAGLYAAVKSYTLVDPQRCYELWDIARQLQHLPGDQIEVGVWRGGSGCVIAAAAPRKRTYLCDTFTGVVKAGEHDAFYRGREHADTSIAYVREIAGRLGLTNVEPVAGIFPDDHQDRFCDLKFSFIHLDVDVYQSAKEAVDFIWPRMPIGAVVAFDDYGMPSCNGITRVVDEYRGRSDRVITYNLNGHAIMVKTA